MESNVRYRVNIHQKTLGQMCRQGLRIVCGGGCITEVTGCIWLCISTGVEGDYALTLPFHCKRRHQVMVSNLVSGHTKTRTPRGNQGLF